MKKLFAACAAGLAALCLTACASNSSSFAATYFLRDPSIRDITEVNESLSYRVYSFSGTDELNGYEKLLPALTSGTEKLKFSVSDGSKYVTSITTLADKSGYEFNSTLTINGVYTFGNDETYEVVNDVTTLKVVFKGINDKFVPVSVEKYMKNTFPTSAVPTGASQFVTTGCTYKIEYGKNAVITVTPDDDETSVNYYKSLSEKDVTVKKYNKKDFVDNDLLFTAFRNFDYASGFTFSFSTIDALSGSLTSASATVIGESGKSPVKLVTADKKTQLSTVAYNACGVKFSTTGEYGKPYAYCYYALSKNGSGEVSEDKDKENSTRRVPLIIAQPLIHNTGYLVMALNTTNFGL